MSQLVGFKVFCHQRSEFGFVHLIKHQVIGVNDEVGTRAAHLRQRAVSSLIFAPLALASATSGSNCLWSLSERRLMLQNSPMHRTTCLRRGGVGISVISGKIRDLKEIQGEACLAPTDILHPDL